MKRIFKEALACIKIAWTNIDPFETPTGFDKFEKRAKKFNNDMLAPLKITPVVGRPDLAAERKAFETWASGLGYNVVRDDGSYRLTHVEALWLGWKERAKR